MLIRLVTNKREVDGDRTTNFKLRGQYVIRKIKKKEKKLITYFVL